MTKRKTKVLNHEARMLEYIHSVAAEYHDTDWQQQSAEAHFDSYEQNEIDNHAEAHRRAGTPDHNLYEHCEHCTIDAMIPFGGIACAGDEV